MQYHFLMRKSEIISRCLVNSKFFASLDEAELAVESIFSDEFSNDHFLEWNQNVDDATANNIILSVGNSSSINVKKFIEGLW